MALSKRQAVHWMFDVAVCVKAFNGALEIAGGSFLVLKPGWIGSTADALAASLLIQHPASWFAQMIGRWSDGLTADTERFASIYLLAHGVAKLFIAWGLIREKLWAFPTALVVFGLLILYQVYRLAHTHSLTLALLITVDIVVCYLIWREYGFRREDIDAGIRTANR
jgi:uncharacterized membrane protein